MLHTAGTVEAYITWASTWHTVCMFLTAVFNDNVEAWHQQCGRGTKLTLKKKKTDFNNKWNAQKKQNVKKYVNSVIFKNANN